MTMVPWTLMLLVVLEFKNSFSSVEMDLLLPYSNVVQMDTRKTRRYVRGVCQGIKHGNRMHESIKPKETMTRYETKYIMHEFSHQIQYGHRTIVKDPLNMISVLEPAKVGGCKHKNVCNVEITSDQQNCFVAINAGFFNSIKDKPDYGKCLGNIISNGNFVQGSGGVQNANFGIRKDGTVVIGYLSEDEVKNKSNPFVQLITGVGWVLRNGTNYLEESSKAECRDLETTGALSYFFSVKSARTLIGFDENGYVHLIQFDGKTGKTGITLHDAADYLKTIGIKNAINLDGGGSATYVINSSVVNYPGDTCTQNGEKILCPRNVSTIICVHGRKTMFQVRDSLEHCCNRNYLLVIGLTTIIGLCLVINIFLCNSAISYRSRVVYLTSSTQKRDALRSLLENGNASELETDEDEL